MTNRVVCRSRGLRCVSSNLPGSRATGSHEVRRNVHHALLRFSPCGFACYAQRAEAFGHSSRIDDSSCKTNRNGATTSALRVSVPRSHLQSRKFASDSIPRVRQHADRPVRRTQSKRVTEIDGVSGGESIEIHPPREPDGVFLREVIPLAVRL